MSASLATRAMDTDWEAVVFIAALIAITAAGCGLVAWDATRDLERLSRRFVSPQHEAVSGPGFERTRHHTVAEPSDVDALPRSPLAPTDVADPRPGASVGPDTPAGAVAPLLPPAASAGLQTPVGSTHSPEARAHRATHRQAIQHA